MNAAVLVTFATLVAQTPTPAATPRYERSIAIAAPGPQRLDVDATLLAGGAPFTVVHRGTGDLFVAEDGLADLRLFGADGREIPYLLVYPRIGEPRWVQNSAQPLASTEKTSGFEVDLGEQLDISAIDVAGLPMSFMKRFRLEASGDRQHWTMVVSEGTLFGLPDQGLRETSVRFAPGRYRYVRLTWDDTHSGKVPLPSSVSARLVTKADAPAPTLVPLPIERRPSEPGRGRYHLTLPGARLPIVALQIDAGGTYVFRQASVTEPRLSSGRAEPMTIGRALLVRDQRGDAPALRIGVAPPPRQAELDLLVEDEGNPPLDIRRVSAELALLPSIYFEASGPVVARYGDPSRTRPVYDLEAARESIDLATVPQARWESSSARSIATPPAGDVPVDIARTGAPIEVAGFRYARAIADSSADLLALPLDAAVLAHSAGAGGQFADLRIVDATGRQVPWLVERRPEPLPIPLKAVLATPEAETLKPHEGANRTVYRLTLPYPRLNDATLVLGTNARVFRRKVTLGIERPADRRHRDPWFDPADTERWWEHRDESSTPPALSLQVPSTDATELTLAVDEGDNSALPITSVQLLLPSYRLRFFRPPSSARLVYGRDDLAPARYDLALLAPRVLGAAATDVTMAAEQSTKAAAADALISPRMFWGVLAVAVAVLLGLLAVLLRQPGESRG